MFSKVPIEMDRISKDKINSEILRTGISAEIDAINLYEQMSAMTDNDNISKLLLDIAKEEKTHIGEFETLLLNHDHQQAKELIVGQKEVGEMGIEILHPIQFGRVPEREDINDAFDNDWCEMVEIMGKKKYVCLLDAKPDDR